MSLLSSADPVLRALADDEQQNDDRMQRQGARFAQCMDTIREKIRHMQQADQQKQSANAGVSPVDLSTLLPSSYLLFLELKSISRQLTNLGESTKAQLLERKKRLDAVNLQCESILYEQGHLQKMIAVQRDFHSAYPVPDLVADEEFARDNPTAPSDQKTHAGWMARLQDELRRRQELVSQQKQLESRNDALAVEFDEMQQRKREFILMSKDLFAKLKTVEENLSANLDKEVDYFQLDAGHARSTTPMER